MRALLDSLAFSSLWVAASAAALCAASARALGVEPTAASLALAAAGTIVIYNIDRLRDVERDRATSPRRTEFVLRWRAALVAITAAAALVAGALALHSGSRAVALLVPVAALGLLHRRLKRFAWWKPFYVSGAWTAVVVGLPALAKAPVPRVAWAAAIVSSTIAANVIASNLRDGEAAAARFGARVPLRLARGAALAAGVLALVAPMPVRSLAPIPLTTLVALAAFRPSELYGFIAVDGALLIGALLSLTLA